MGRLPQRVHLPKVDIDSGKIAKAWEYANPSRTPNLGIENSEAEAAAQTG